jgi:cell wall-associated NlpC family hydrolase
MPAISRLQRLAVLPIMLAAVLVGSLFSFVPHADAATSRTQRINVALKLVADQQGDPYVWGAAGPNAFDCSGLVYYSYRRAGFTNIPRTAAQQAQAARRIAPANMRKGDLVFFYGSGGVYHVGVYAGQQHGQRIIIHAPRPGSSVKRERIWTSSWFPARLG